VGTTLFCIVVRGTNAPIGRRQCTLSVAYLNSGNGHSVLKDDVLNAQERNIRWAKGTFIGKPSIECYRNNVCVGIYFKADKIKGTKQVYYVHVGIDQRQDATKVFKTLTAKRARELILAYS
jgi:hypothetical protein